MVSAKTEYKETRAGPKKLVIPEEWEVKDLGELVTRLTNGISESQSSDDTGFPVTRIETIAQGWVNHEKVGYVDADKSEYSDYKLEEGDVLFSHINSIPHIGKTAQYSGGKELYHGMNLLLIRFDEEEIEEDYGYIYLNSKLARDFWVSNCKQAVNQASLNQGEVKSLPIIMPSRREQRRIAEILSTVEEAIQQTDELIETSKELKKGLMQDLLTKGIGHDEFREVSLGPKTIEIAESWTHQYFNDVVDVNPSYDTPDEDSFEFLPMDAVNEEGKGIEYWNERDADDCTRIRFKEGDTVYAKITPCTENGKIGFIGELDGEIAFGSTEFLVFSPTEKMDPKYVFYLTNLPPFRQVTISLMEGSTGRQRVPMDLFKKNLKIPVPPLDEQREIAERLSVVDEKIRQEEEYREKLEELKKGLMQDLLTGEVRVEA